MQDETATLHLIDLGVAYGGVGYLILAVATMHLALRCRAQWLMVSAVCFGVLAFVKLSIACRGILVWYGMVPVDAVSPVAVQFCARFDSVILLLAAISVAVFAVAWSRHVARD